MRRNGLRLAVLTTAISDRSKKLPKSYEGRR